MGWTTVRKMRTQMVKMSPPNVRIGSKPHHYNKGTLEQSKTNMLKFMLVETQMLNFISLLLWVG